MDTCFAGVQDKGSASAAAAGMPQRWGIPTPPSSTPRRGIPKSGSAPYRYQDAVQVCRTVVHVPEKLQQIFECLDLDLP